jgi:prolyl-tRNA editing enzyme YbaK/EbsC (Cys-tRNA(Pro) deacylase)
VSLKAYDEVLPAAGSVNSAVRISVALLEQVTQGQWVDVCQGVAG